MFVFDFFDIDNHDVFISYAKKDATRIKPLRDALTAAGIKYWIDDRIDGSENFLAEIPDAIKKCSIVLFVASQNSANSEWTQKELVYARKFKKEIFPYKLDDFQFENCAELDFFFTNIQWKENVGDVVAGLGKKLGINVPTQTPPSVMKRMTGTLIIKTDLDCRVFNYGEEIGIAKAGEYTKFELPLGDNELKYVGLESEEDCYEETEPIVINENRRTSVRVTLLDKYNARRAKEEAGRKAYLLGLPDDEFESFYEGGKYGFKVASTGEIIIPLKYDGADDFSEGLAMVKLNGKGWGFIDKTGKEVIPLKYDIAWYFSEGLVNVKLNGKWGFIDKTGKEVIPLKYDIAYPFNGGKATIELNEERFYIDKNGNRIE